MKRSFLFQIFVLLLLTNLTLGAAGLQPAQAKAVGAPADAPGQAELTFADLGMAFPQTLTGPIGEYAIKFNLPVQWKPSGTASIALDLSAFFSSLVPTDSTTSVSGLIGGNLSVFLNGVQLQVSTLQKSGDQTLQIKFDAARLALPARDSHNELRIRWDGSISCLMNLLSSATILPTSKISFAYTEEARPFTLNDFPVPFMIENPVNPVGLAIVLPDAPSVVEIRAALIMAAGIGQLTRGGAPVELVTLGEYLVSSKARPNILVAATQDHLANPAFGPAELPVKAQAAKGEGTLQLFKQGAGTYGILVSGDETGIIKAAQVLSAGQVVAAGDAQTMIVSAVNPVASAYGKENTTLEELGVGELVFTYQNGLAQSFDFFIPAGEEARADASFNLVLSHSQQLDYLRSGLQVKLNGYPAISLRLMDTNSNQTMFTMILPANLIRPGRNTVDLVADLKIRDICTPPLESIAWMRVSASSTLHLPLESTTASVIAPKTFKEFPDAFLSGTGLNNVTFILSPGDANMIKAAKKLAYGLGAALPQKQPIQLRVSFANAVDPALTKEANVILVGKPLDFAALNSKENFPALVFKPDNTLSEASTLTIVSKPAASGDVGYLAIRGYEAQSGRILLAVLGNSAAAVGYAVDSVASKNVSASNFAYVVGKGIQTSWLDKGIASGEAVVPAAQATKAAVGSSTAETFRQEMLVWVVPMLIGLVALLAFFVFAEIRHAVRKD